MCTERLGWPGIAYSFNMRTYKNNSLPYPQSEILQVRGHAEIWGGYAEMLILPYFSIHMLNLYHRGDRTTQNQNRRPDRHFQQSQKIDVQTLNSSSFLRILTSNLLTNCVIFFPMLSQPLCAHTVSI